MNMLVQGGQGVHRSSTVSTVDMKLIEWDLDHQICSPNLAQSFVAVHRSPEIAQVRRQNKGTLRFVEFVLYDCI